METPFSFLKNAPPDWIERIHKIIDSNKGASQKDIDILNTIPGTSPCIDRYLTWIRKKREVPPTELIIELPTKLNATLFQLIDKKKWDEIRPLFTSLTPKTLQIAEEWYSVLVDDRKLVEVRLKEAKEILIHFTREQELLNKEPRISVDALIGHYEHLNLNTVGGRIAANSATYADVAAGGSPKFGPKVSDISQESRIGGTYNTTYGIDYQSPSTGTKRQEPNDGRSSKPVTEYHEYDTSGQVKRPSDMDEQDRSLEPTEKRSRNEGQSSGTSSAITSSSALENSMEVLTLAETLKDSLDKENSAGSSHSSSQKGEPKASNGTKRASNGKGSSRGSPPPASTRPSAPLVEQDYSIGDVDPKNVFNILLLGETGVGKTTFINSFANYVKYESLDEALEKGPIILMKSSISQTHNVEREDGTTEMKQRIITVEANCNKGQKNSSNENFADKGESRTQEPLIHCIPWKEDGTVKLLRIIDTPGVNDTRGADQDETNFDKIIKLIGKLGSLSAICILLKPNESTLSMGFRNCLDNVLIKLHRSATKNILFCFTNTRSTLYRPGDTMAPLVRYLDELERSAGVMITPNKHNMFCFDNDCFRYMCILMKLPRAKGEKTHATLSAGWVHNAQECQKLLEKIQGLVAHQVEDTVNINNARRFLTAMARPLTEIAQNHIVNRRMVETQMKQVRELSEKGEQLGSLVEQKELVIYKRPLEKPRTICTDPKCNDTITGADGQLHQVPKKICHDNCFLAYCVTPLEIGHKSLKSCATFNNSNYNCMECKCSWKIHMHMTYEIEKKLESVASLAEKAEFRACTTHKQRAQVVLKDLENKLANIENEYDLIKKTSFEFSAFLKFNSLKTGTDPYFDYLNNAIETEKNMAKQRGDMTLLIDLKGLLKEYNKGVTHHLEELKEKRRPPLTTAELWNKVENLSRMKLSGTLIADVAKAAKEEQEAASREEFSSD